MRRLRRLTYGTYFFFAPKKEVSKKKSFARDLTEKEARQEKRIHAARARFFLRKKKLGKKNESMPCAAASPPNLRHLLLFCAQKRSKQEKIVCPRSYEKRSWARKTNPCRVRRPRRLTYGTYFFFAPKKEVSKKKSFARDLTKKEAGQEKRIHAVCGGYGRLGVSHAVVCGERGRGNRGFTARLIPAVPRPVGFLPETSPRFASRPAGKSPVRFSPYPFFGVREKINVAGAFFG